METISVIVPVYQAEAFLENCIESILHQEDTGYELLLVDDGSTDASPEICDRYAGEYPQVRAVHMQNKGAAAARNYGIEQAKGELLTFVDSDDEIAPAHLQYLRSLRERTGAQIVKSAHRKCTPKQLQKEQASVQETASEALTEEYSCYEGENCLKALLYQEHFMSVPWGMLMEKGLWEEIRFPEGTEAEDMGTIYRVFAAAQRAVYGERTTYYYLQRGSSTMYATSKTRNPAYYKHCRKMLQFVKEKYPDCYPAALSRHYSACCQILSETPLYFSGTRFGARLKQDIYVLSRRVRKDGAGRKQNRAAARLGGISPSVLHLLLRMYYLYQRMQLK
ncbi:MAG: glycosyltransferase [Lachnospiraceae bacterium]|nr:glycosyltransferase [Lachnospiraceae bacterium]